MAATISRSSGFAAGSGGGNSSALSVTAAQVLKTGAGVIGSVICLGAGTLTINDCATTGAAAITNEIYSAAVTAGQVIPLYLFPYAVGLCISALPSQISIAFS